MRNRIEEITENFLSKNTDALGGERQFEKLSNAIDYAWNNWEESVISTYYDNEKPEYANNQFIIEWIDNELGNNPDEWETVLNS